MLYNVITQNGMTVGQSRTLEDARDLAEDADGVVKYTCPDCGAKVWSKAGLHIDCSDCACSFEEENDEKGEEK